MMKIGHPASFLFPQWSHTEGACIINKLVKLINTCNDHSQSISQFAQRFHACCFIFCSSGCQNDIFGYSYRGRKSVSAKGLHCLPWNSVGNLFLRSLVFPNITSRIILTKDSFRSKWRDERLARVKHEPGKDFRGRE